MRTVMHRAAHAVFGCDTSRKEDVRVTFNELIAGLDNEYKGLETGIKLTL